MSVKRYGIFAAWAPRSVLTGEGLGRYLAQLLKAAEQRDDIQLTVLCSQWSRRAIEDLCNDEQINPANFEIVTPDNAPFIWRIISIFVSEKKAKKRQRFYIKKFVLETADAFSKFATHIMSRIVAARNIVSFTLASLVGLAALIVFFPVLFAFAIGISIYRFVRIATAINRRLLLGQRIGRWLNTEQNSLITVLPNSKQKKKK